METATRISASQWVCKSLGSSLGRKYLMALTGAGMAGFLVGHLAGNLLIFFGPNALNTYAAILKANPLLLWGTRGFLLVCLILHVFTAVSLTLENRRARKNRYVAYSPIRTSVASRTMFFSGVLILFYAFFHLAHFTLFLTHPNFLELHDSLGRHDVYSMVILGFQDGKVAAMYVVAMILLGMHLFHGLSSMFQSLGIRDLRMSFFVERFLPGLALGMSILYISIPLAVQLGWLGGAN